MKTTTLIMSENGHMLLEFFGSSEVKSKQKLELMICCRRSRYQYLIY